MSVVAGPTDCGPDEHDQGMGKKTTLATDKPWQKVVIYHWFKHVNNLILSLHLC